MGLGICIYVCGRNPTKMRPDSKHYIKKISNIENNSITVLI